MPTEKLIILILAFCQQWRTGKIAYENEPTSSFQKLIASLYLDNRDPFAYVRLLVGLFFYGTGVVFLLKANLGMDPWGCFHVGITKHLPLTLGRVSQSVGLLIILASLFLRIYPGIGTLLNMILIGFFIDLLNPHIPFMKGLAFQSGMLGAGVLLIGIASGLYINARLGAGPRDSLMLGLSRKTGRSIRLVRNSIEVCVLGAGYLLGGPVGVGTVVYALAIGPCVQFFLQRLPGMAVKGT